MSGAQGLASCSLPPIPALCAIQTVALITTLQAIIDRHIITPIEQPKDEMAGLSDCTVYVGVRGAGGHPPLCSQRRPAGMPKPAGRVNAGVKTLQRNEERPSSVVHFYHTGSVPTILSPLLGRAQSIPPVCRCHGCTSSFAYICMLSNGAAADSFQSRLSSWTPAQSCRHGYMAWQNVALQARRQADQS
ncbi:hypothetical protein Q8A73_009749 [Channa argus]|nr:hypothetical protein Q8A73_009749 [Channa argus]